MALNTEFDKKLINSMYFYCEFFIIAFHNISATQAVPRFIQEITDVYTKEGDIALFECTYSGNPKPGNYIHIAKIF